MHPPAAKGKAKRVSRWVCIMLLVRPDRMLQPDRKGHPMHMICPIPFFYTKPQGGSRVWGKDAERTDSHVAGGALRMGLLYTSLSVQHLRDAFVSVHEKAGRKRLHAAL